MKNEYNKYIFSFILWLYVLLSLEDRKKLLKNLVKNENSAHRHEIFENLTKNYYNDYFKENPDKFWNKHIPLLEKIVDFIPHNWSVLDLWCWNGRNSLLFAKQWYNVQSVDVSKEWLNVLESRVTEDIKNNIQLFHSSIDEYLTNHQQKYSLIIAQNSLQYDLDWESQLKKIQDATMLWWYNFIAWPLYEYDQWKKLDYEKIIDLYKDWEFVHNHTSLKWKDIHKPWLFLITHKKND